MKTELSLLLTFATLALQAQDNNSPATFADDINWRFLPGVGVVYDETGDLTADRFVKSKLYSLGKQHDESIPYGDYRLFDDPDKARVGFRLQDQIDTTGTSAAPATFNWERMNGAENWQARGALLMDLYLPSDLPWLGYRTGCKDCKEGGNSLRFTFAGEINRDDLADEPIDQFSLGFFASYNVRFMPNITPSAADAYFTQPVRLGALFTRDNLTGQEQWSLLARVDPVFRIFRKLIIGARNRYEDSGKKLGLSTKLTEAKDIFEKDTQPAPGPLPEDVTNPSQINIAGVDIRPHLALRLADNSEIASVTDVDDALLQYGLKVALPLFRGRVELGYEIMSHTAVSGGQTFTHQTAFADLSPRPRSDKSPLFIRVAWQSGQAAPDFTQRDGVSVGLGLRF
jgi:hypothetical protein